MGLELEESQCMLFPDIQPTNELNIYRRQLKVFADEQAGIPKSLQTSSLKDQRNILKKRFQRWEAVHGVYMPSLLQIQTILE